MSKLIEVKHPYQISNISNLNDYLNIIKHLTNIIENQGYIEKKDGILLPLRWCNNINNFVVDRGTDLKRDIIGISLNNINDFNIANELKIGIRYLLNSIKDNKDFYDLCVNYGLIKNTQRFIAFEFTNGLTNKINNITTCYPLGLFIRNNSEKREGILTKNNNAFLIDNSNEFIELVCKTNINYFTLNKHIKCGLKNIFEDFFKSIEKRSIELFINNKNYNINIKSFLQENLNKNFHNKKFNINNKKYSCFNIELYKKIKENQIKDFKLFNEYLNSFVLLYINELYGEELKKKLYNKKVEGIIVQDKKNNILFKFTGNFNLLNSNINIIKEENKNYNNLFLLPRTF